MDLSSGASQGIADAQLASFIEQENQKQRFQTVVHTLTEQCWELCAPSISSRLDGKSETCLANCVERFIDSSNYIINKLGQEGAAAAGRMNSSEFSSSTDFSLGSPDVGLSTPDFGSDYGSSSSQQQQQQNKSSWKFW
jgi:mitochondrial import inner membrane translocase subunit TIM8